jgi:mono/diheme cytochrome c family protein
MKRTHVVASIFIAIGLAMILVGCSRPESPRGFRLPDGDAAAGGREFVQLGCNGCHTVRGETLAPSELQSEIRVELGGEVSRVKTYGELVTSIINPSHRFASGYPLETTTIDGQSRMPSYNDHMTVQQLVDLVSFLQPHYKVVPPNYEYVPYM